MLSELPMVSIILLPAHPHPHPSSLHSSFLPGTPEYPATAFSLEGLIHSTQAACTMLWPSSCSFPYGLWRHKKSGLGSGRWFSGEHFQPQLLLWLLGGMASSTGQVEVHLSPFPSYIQSSGYLLPRNVAGAVRVRSSVLRGSLFSHVGKTSVF